MMLEESDDDQKTYSNNASSKDVLITLTVIPVNKKCRNVISGVIGIGHDISLLIAQVLERGYLFKGEKKLNNEINLFHYTKKKISFLISKEITSTGAYQILFTCS